ncbi:MAG: helix-turn-helix transcriptional regulator [Tenericutes bacterium]|nr:helix-turn-helix transcriptional regulator [Mycoplasmatota bacterium]
MNINIKASIIKRREEMHDFYYQGFGDRIKRKRQELNLTQETIAKGICSNTYVSKMENNKIIVNKEHLFLIMERMGMPTDNISLPEEMIDILKKSIKYFFYKDIESYKKLYLEIEKYDFGILLYVARFGYYILTKDAYNAKILHNDMYKYLNHLEDFGFTTFLIYSGFYNVMINDYQSARMIIETIQNKIQNDEMIYALYSYLKFDVYGNLYLFNMSRDGLVIAENLFLNYKNIERMRDIFIKLEIFYLYEETNRRSSNFKQNIQGLNDSDKNEFLLFSAIKANNPLEYLEHLSKNGDYYLAGKFIVAKHYFSKGKIKEFKKVKKEINDLHYLQKSEIDYGNLLKLYEEDKKLYIKDYLINYVLPIVLKKQNLYLLKIVLEEISFLLKEKNRYKDALIYLEKFQEIKNKLQFQQKITAE